MDLRASAHVDAASRFVEDQDASATQSHRPSAAFC